MVGASDQLLTPLHAHSKTRNALPESITVRVGSNKRDADGREVAVKRFRVHENYQQRYDSENQQVDIDNVIGLIELEEPLPDNDARIKPIAMGEENNDAHDFTLVRFNGDKLERVEIERKPLNGCQDLLAKAKPKRVASDKHMCALIAPNNASPDDSGAPLMRDGKLYGLAAEFYRTDMTLFSDALKFKDWIDRNKQHNHEHEHEHQH